MALFSKEYIIKKEFKDTLPDFNYWDEYNCLNEGETFHETCEGLGVYGITKKENAPYLIGKDANSKFILLDYYTFLHQKK